jgi:electron transfer flavoprotein alpha subunit
LIASKKEFWVYIEIDRKGSMMQVGSELLGMAKKIINPKRDKVVAIVIGYNVEHIVAECVSWGADEVLFVDRPDFKNYSTDAYTDAMYSLVSNKQPEALFIGSTSKGRDFAPRLACRLSTGLTADCTGVSFYGKDTTIAWTRPALSNHLMATVICPESKPQMGTVRPGVFPCPSQNWYRKVPIKNMTGVCPLIDARSWLMQVIEEEESQTFNLSQAKIIVSGGLGLGSKEGFKLVAEFAKEIGAMVGATRKVVEAGWIGRAHQVGQTGKTVTPELYIACGISGSLQHLVGMQFSKCIVAINSDPEAPIFSVADYCIVGSSLEILPKLIKEIREKKVIKQSLIEE